MQNKKFDFWFSCYLEQALILKERRLIVLVGDNTWTDSLLRSVYDDSCQGIKNSQKTWFVYGENTCLKPNVTKQRFRDKLGRESQFVVFQDQKLSIDALAGLSGTLLAGGIFFLLINDQSQIAKSLFCQRFIKQVHTFKQHVVIEQSDPIYPKIELVNTKYVDEQPQIKLPYHCLTEEQSMAVDAVIKVLKGKRNQPLVLTADRGRGKSSALAIACGQLLKKAKKDNTLNIVITAIDLGSLSVFFSQIASSLPTGTLQKGLFTFEGCSVKFMPIDQLIKHKPIASLVLVDEAAALPIYLLESLLSHYARLVFATTIHGYEGAGRGFTLKFQKALTLKYPQWRSLHLHEPIRWRVNDPLEKLVFDTCLLNAELPCLPEGLINNYSLTTTLVFKQFTAAELVKNELLLKQIIAVLVTAHYQTKPSDVKMLLDNEKMQVVCLLTIDGNQPAEIEKYCVVAVALLISEGGTIDPMIDEQTIDPQVINAINHGQRRLKNHFVPQSLLTQCSVEDAFQYTYLRVMRIAVHPQLQQRGIGSYFLGKISQFSAAQNIDFLASSFGATSSLLSFWFDNDFRLARIGFTKDKASGEQSALVLKALSVSSLIALRAINKEFYRSFDYLLTDEYKQLSAELVLLILKKLSASECCTLSAKDNANIEGFSQGYKQYSGCVFSLHLWLKHQVTLCNESDASDLLVFISRVMQKHSIADVCNTYQFTGKKALETFLRAKVRLMLSR